ncbi:MAG: hypothetical protein QXZ25_04575 [Candidatus Bathyarchaeia archaeon]
MDGSGKSTVIQAIESCINATSPNNLFVVHLRPSLLPPLARLKGIKSVTEGPVTNPHGSPPSGVLLSLARVIYYTLDYVIGYWLKIRPKIAKRPAIVIFDRYAYDMVIDPLRFRIGISSKFVAMFTKFVPKPDLLICLDAPVEVILSRKKELPKEEIQRQIEALRQFAHKESNAYWISTDRPVQEIANEILSIISDYRRRSKRH